MRLRRPGDRPLSAMEQESDIPTPIPPGRRAVRVPSRRASLLLAAAALGIGVGLGAAIGPAPEASLAGPSGLGGRLALLVAGAAARERAASTGPAASSQPSAVESATAEPAATPAARSSRHAKSAEAAPAPESEKPASEAKPKQTAQTKLPAIADVWLIELSGESFEAAEAAPASAPYIDTKLIPSATLLPGWLGLQASAFASEAALAVPPAGGSAPPLLHSIVQPPCPEGAAGDACAPETPGQIKTADEFLKATLATITGTALYREHGVVVVTWGSVGVASQSELPAGSSTTTLTYQPPAGAALLSPFATAGRRSSTSFNATSPRQTLEALLR